MPNRHEGSVWLEKPALGEDQELVPLAEIAKRLGLDRSNARRWLLKNGFRFLRIRTPETKGQLTLAMPEQDVQAAIELRKRLGFSVGRQRGAAITSQDAENGGCFYVIQLVPEFEPNRIKLGFSTNIDKRLASYRTIAPTARLVKTWPCRFSWEQAAMACAVGDQCKRIGAEVYDCTDLDSVIARLDQFFHLMPKASEYAEGDADSLA